MEDKLIKFLKKQKSLKSLDIDKLIEKPRVESHGDFSLPMFLLSKELKKSPMQIAKDVANEIGSNLPDFLEKVIAVGPYVNFYLNSLQIVESVINDVFNGKLFKVKNSQEKKIMIEYPSPNTNKALHLGQSRNMFIGNVLCNILTKTGTKIVRTSMNNDRGIAICKSMISYQLFGESKTPKDMNMKSDEFVSHWYVMYGTKNKENPSLNLDEKAQEMLVAWEDGDVEIRKLWKKLMDWVFEGYKKTYKNYKLKKFDKEYYESDIYSEGKDIVLDALNKKVKGFAKEEDGAIYVDLEDEGWGKKYLLRGDGTTLYMTQDLYLTKLKDEEFKCDKYIFVVGEDQKYHFEVLFEILGRLGFGGVDKNYHFSYGYVYNEYGKKFSSRKGEVIDANWLLDEVEIRAKKNLLSKNLTKGLNKSELDSRSKIIGYCAVAFSFLKVNPNSTINFNIDNALSFEGESGPYVQYTYARIKSVLRKANYSKFPNNIVYENMKDNEIKIVKILKEYPDVLLEAADKYKISVIANYLIKLSQSFNEYYQNVPILKSSKKDREIRLVLLDAVSRVIKDGLSLYDIETLEEM